MHRHLIDDLALIAHPPPRPGEVLPAEAFDDAAEHAADQRREWAENLAAACDATGDDPLLLAIETAAGDRDQAQLLIRRFAAYARHITPSRRPAAALAEAAGMDRKTLERHVTARDVDAVRALLAPVVPAGADAPRESVLAAAETGIRGVFDRAADRCGLSRLDWTVQTDRPGHAPGAVLVGHVARDDIAADAVRVKIVRAWAAHLGLTETAGVPHAATWIGEAEGLPVEIWTIADSAGWDAVDDDR